MAIKKVTHKNVDEIISQGMTAGSPQTLDVDLTVSAVNRVNDPVTGLNQKAAALHTHAINELSDVSTTGATDGQGLVFFSDVDGLGNPGWKPDTVASTAGATNLDDLNDVTATGATDGQVLSYNSGTWSPATVTSGGSGATNMEQLSDTDLVTTAPQSEDFLKYNGSQWVPAALPAGGGTSNVANLDDLTDVNAATPAGGQVLAWSSTNNTWEPANPTTADAVVLANSGIVYSTDGIDDEYELGQAPVLTLSINNPQDGEALVFDSSSGDWVNQSVSQAYTLNDLTDVTAAGASSGQVLTSDGAGNWTPSTIVTGTSNVAVMDDLTDVDTTTTAPTDQQVLAWDASNSVWVPTTPAAASGSTAVLTNSGVTYSTDGTDNTYEYGSAPQLTVNISSPQDQQALVYDAATGDWVNGAAVSAGAADLGIAVTTAGGDVDYTFNATTPSGVPSMDTTSLAVGSTMMWNGSSWVDSGLVIETYT